MSLNKIALLLLLISFNISVANGWKCPFPELKKFFETAISLVAEKAKEAVELVKCTFWEEACKKLCESSCHDQQKAIVSLPNVRTNPPMCVSRERACIATSCFQFDTLGYCDPRESVIGRPYKPKVQSAYEKAQEKACKKQKKTLKQIAADELLCHQMPPPLRLLPFRSLEAKENEEKDK
ncbi:hypothetical protein niasHS_012876 [Heterodera schachtii]|uniref:Uncharacterized protein n=1 Tax=Heterodera schachtii TaxID=97005 RepID=A0ABD2IN60_HETSC